MSGKNSTALLHGVAVCSFYGESPPKRSRVHETIISRPAFKNLKENLIEFGKQIAEPIKGSELKETDSQDSGHEPKSLDRDSPIPLKNLGNTCYENSIIQCLFSLNMFMENFDRSMREIRQFIVKPETPAGLFDVPNNPDEELQEEMQQDVNKDIATIKESDVRYRIADAFDKLYKSYTQKRIQIEANNQSSNNNTAPSTTHLDDDNLAPIALVSSTATTNEQSEIETRLEDLKSAVGEISSQFNSTHQQDASEFFYHVIDSIQEFYQALNRTKDDDNPVTKAFELELDYLIRCPKCHHKNLSEPEKIRTLPLALPHANNEISANQVNEESNHETNGAPTPPSSDLGLDSPELSPIEDQHSSLDEKENQAATEDDIDEIAIPTTTEDNSNNTASIAKLDLTDNPSQAQSSSLSSKDHQDDEPKRISTLCDALNNYFKDDLLEYSCSQPGCNSKQRTRKCLIRKLPQILFITLARYSYSGKKNLDEIEAPFELSVPLRENKSPSHSPQAHCQLDDDDNTYQLVAVVCHLGSSLNAGHYTSYVYNQNNLSWYSCDDDSITKVKETDVKNDSTKSGYCFFYAHKSCVNQKPQQLKQQMPHQQPQHRHLASSTIKNNRNLKQDGTIFYSENVVDSSIVLTPESSPTSYAMSHGSNSHEIHSCCENGTTTINDIDDWS